MYDAEDYMRALVAVLKANLNTEIAAINTRKGDFSIETIESDAWFFGGPDEKVWNYPVFVLYAPMRLDAEDQQEDNFIERITMQFEVLIFDNNQEGSEKMNYRMFRYIEAFKAVLFKNFDEFQGITRPIINTLVPDTFTVDSKRILTGGVKVSALKTAY